MADDGLAGAVSTMHRTLSMIAETVKCARVEGECEASGEHTRTCMH